MAEIVVGKARSSRGKPWVEGRDTEIQHLQNNITKAKHSWQDIQSRSKGGESHLETSLKHAKAELNRARKHYQKRIRHWEWDYWDNVAQEATEAQATGDIKGIFEAHKKLRITVVKIKFKHVLPLVR